MVECGRRPADELEILSVVFRMALRAFGAARLIVYDRGMVAAIGCQPLSNFLVTIQTAKVGRPRPNCMARCAAGRTIELLVCAGERTR